MQLYRYEKEHIQTLRKSLAECTVLLKSNGDFPLDKACKIAAYGSGVRNTIKGGTGSGEVNSRFSTSIEKGLEDAGFILTTKKWMDSYEQVRIKAKKDFRKVIKARAKANHTQPVIEGMGAVMPEPEYELPLDGDGDVAVYVLSRISGEGNDRRVENGDVLLTKTEQRDILTLNRNYKKFMLVLNVGGVVDLSSVQEVDNILLLSQLGVETGAVLADLLLGKAYPSGKLTTTWSAWEDYCSIGEFGEQNDTRYQEGIYVGYRYFDSIGKRALFPFGYGLGYTTFSVSGETVEAAGEKITVTAKVRNTGLNAGKEVVQIYVSAPEGKLDKYYIFYHRQTNRSMFSRQGCAEKIVLLPDGRIPQTEMTSEGLNGKPLPGIGTYPTYCVANLHGKRPQAIIFRYEGRGTIDFLEFTMEDIYESNQTANRIS